MTRFLGVMRALMSARGGANAPRIARLSKEFAWIAAGNMAAIVGGVVGVRVLTELLEPSAYGQLALALTLATLLNQIVMGPLSQGAARFLAPAQEVRGVGDYLAGMRKLMRNASGLVVGGTSIALVALWLAGHGQWAALVVAAMTFAMTVGYSTVLTGIQSAARQRSIVALHQGIEPWLRLLFAAGLIMSFAATSTMVFLGYAAALLCVLGSQCWFSRKLLAEPQTGDAELWLRRIWAYSWPFASWGVFSWAQQSSDRWALGLFASTQEVGLYTVLWQVGFYPVSVAVSAGAQFLAPIFFQRVGDGSDETRKADVDRLTYHLIGVVLALTMLMVLIGFFAHEWIFRVIAAREYAAVSYLLPGVLLAGGLFAAGQAIALNLMSRVTTRAMIRAKILTCLVGVALNVGFAYWQGIAGLVIAGMLFSLQYMVWMLVLFVRR